MKKRILNISALAAMLLLVSQNTYAQQGFGTNKPSKASVIEMKSDSKGLLIPRVALTDLNNFGPIVGNAGITPAETNSLMVYNTNTTTNISPGYYYWTATDTNDGTIGHWQRFMTGTHGVDGVDGKSAYEEWVDAGNTGSEQDFLDSLKGDQGIQGIAGTDGVDGKSAYEEWVDAGNTGSEQDFLDSLKGDQGIQGIAGTDGVDGKSALEIWQSLPGNDGKDGADFIAAITGQDGADGLTPEIGSNGNWEIDGVDTGIAAQGPQGAAGSNGTDGIDGITPHIDATTGNWFVGTTDTGIAAQGPKGDDGKSALEIWKELPGNEDGTEQDFLDALKGVDGAMDLTDGTTTTVTGDGTPTNPYKVEVNSANLTVSEGIQFTGSTDGAGALLIETGIGIADGGITTAKLAEGAVTAAKMSSESAEPGTVPTSNGDGTVTYQAIPETPRFFYMPAVIFDTTVTGTATRDLYQDYVNQFTGADHNISHGPTGTTPMLYTGGLIGSTNAPATIQVFESDDMYYYVTYYDQDVFESLSIDEFGKLTYTVKAGATETSYMNIVFVIK